MRKLDLKEWDRSSHFQYFNKFDYPHYGVCVNVNVSRLLPFCQRNGFSFFSTCMYLLVQAANSVRELRLRVVKGEVWECDLVHPSFTVLSSRDTFNFCLVRFQENYEEFSRDVQKSSEAVKEKMELALADDVRLDLIYLSCLPWLSFTSVSHPFSMNREDTIPRLSWGKYFKEGRKILVPVSLHASHALVDGVHLGKFYKNLDSFIDLFLSSHQGRGKVP